jgi:hypothetical protein
MDGVSLDGDSLDVDPLDVELVNQPSSVRSDTGLGVADWSHSGLGLREDDDGPGVGVLCWPLKSSMAPTVNSGPNEVTKCGRGYVFPLGRGRLRVRK